jgi:hypothetical protein
MNTEREPDKSALRGIQTSALKAKEEKTPQDTEREPDKSALRGLPTSALKTKEEKTPTQQLEEFIKMPTSWNDDFLDREVQITDDKVLMKLIQTNKIMAAKILELEAKQKQTTKLTSTSVGKHPDAGQTRFERDEFLD